MKSKTKIESQLKRKTNDELVDTIIVAKKKEKWLEIAGILSSPRRESINLNLSQIDNLTKEGDTVIIPGKVLSQGEISKKIKIVAYRFSGKTKEKLLKSKIQTSSIMEEIKSNPEAKGIRILTNIRK